MSRRAGRPGAGVGGRRSEARSDARPLLQRSDRQRVDVLEQWFADAARALPWRDRPRGGPCGDGYGALVAEAMLQQTQVERVVPKYRAFMTRFPTVDALAHAPEEDVLACWQGLGYYRRARALHCAARMVLRDMDGVVPQDAAALRRLPGVGRYTAGAIASIAFGIRAPIVDGNVARVVMRWSARCGTAEDHMVWAWRRAEGLVSIAERPGVLNEALMELGATVCTPRTPRCATCPVADACRAGGTPRADRIPAPRPRAARAIVHHHAVVLPRGGRILLERRPARGLWAGLWQPPTIESATALTAAAIAERLATIALNVSPPEPLAAFEFLTTHRRVRFHVYRARTRARRGTWWATDALNELPMAAAQRRVIAVAMDDPPRGREAATTS